MIYGITGNTTKDVLWEPLASTIDWMQHEGLAFCLHPSVAEGLAKRSLLPPDACTHHETDTLSEDSDVILSFGGDGTLLNSAREAGTSHTPILGVNIGRLGFLADVETEQIQTAIRAMEQDAYRVEERTLLDVQASGTDILAPTWALNEFAIERSGQAGLLSIRAEIDGAFLNEYWGDGLIVATPTGSTAYSLSVGGPIIAPGAGVVVLSPVAPHTLTVRPVIVPDTSRLTLRVHSRENPYVVAVDGKGTRVDQGDVVFEVTRATHTIHLIKLLGQGYFDTLRSKLMWGAGKTR